MLGALVEESHPMLDYSHWEHRFGSKPKITSPLVKGDHPEIDALAFLDEKGIQQYQSLIGQLQWAISLGRFDISVVVMTMSTFRSAPREESSVYSGEREELPKEAPEPLGKPVVTTTYVDANLYHCMLTGKSVTGVLHLFNKTPVDWYAKKQGKLETVTYGSEFVAARTATDDNHHSLRYLGVTVKETLVRGDHPTTDISQWHAISCEKTMGSPSRDNSRKVHVGTTHGESNKTRVHHLVYAGKHDGRLLFWKRDTKDLLTEENRRHKPIRSCSVRWGVTRFPCSWELDVRDCHLESDRPHERMSTERLSDWLSLRGLLYGILYELFRGAQH